MSRHKIITYLRSPQKDTSPSREVPPVKLVNVSGRKEYEALVRDADMCSQLGLDQHYEVMVYLKRWGGWLSHE